MFYSAQRLDLFAWCVRLAGSESVFECTLNHCTFHFNVALACLLYTYLTVSSLSVSSTTQLLYRALHGTAPRYLSDRLQYMSLLPTTGRGRLHSSSRPPVFSTSTRRDVSLSAHSVIALLQLLVVLAHDSETVYLPTSHQPAVCVCPSLVLAVYAVLLALHYS